MLVNRLVGWLLQRPVGHVSNVPETPARWNRAPQAAALLILILLGSAPLLAQDANAAKSNQPDFIPAGYDDYQNMLDQLGIKKMRKGRDAKVKDTSDEATAHPYKESMPDLMTFKNGSKVK